MRLKVLGQNKTEVEINGNTTVLFSYNTPVAALVNGLFFRTEKNWSKTTTKHINQWLGDSKAELAPQSYFDDLMKG